MPPHDEIKLPREYDTLHTGIALYDPNGGRIVDANERLEEIFGYTTEQLRELSVEMYTANTYSYSESAFLSRLEKSAAGSPQQFTWRIKRADGELIWVQIHLSKQRRADRTGVRAELRDITDYYETHHRAELFWRMLRHNLRNKAAIILGNANLIPVQTESDSLREAAATIRAQIKELGSMTDSVKEIEQAVATTKTHHIRRHATTAVQDVIDEFNSEYPAANIKLCERAEMGIEIDDAFSHALIHALENAVIHSNNEKPVVEVGIGSSPNTGRVEICIEDTNPPIPDDELKALFTPVETTSTSHGTGVGLFVMKWCIESLGGEIEFNNRDPQGNAVRFYLPPKAPPDEKRGRTPHHD